MRFIHREIDLLKSENHDQNTQIAVLKEMVIESRQNGDNSLQELLDRRRKEHQHSARVKRPYRLLPKGGPKNNIPDDARASRKFYGPPIGCSDLSELGHTLNGFYQVKSLNSNSRLTNDYNSAQLETVYCSFKQPEGSFDASKVEKRVISKLGLNSKDVVHQSSSSYSAVTQSYTVTKQSNSRIERIHFYARATNTIVLADLEVMKFDYLLLNLGGSFNATSGVFTASKSGIYKFLFQGTFTFPYQATNNIIYFFITVLKNGTATEYITFEPNRIIFRSMVAALKLDKGDRIQLKYFKSEQNKNFERVIVLHSFMFSGYLII